MPEHKHLDFIQASCLISESDMRTINAEKSSSLAYYKRGYIDENGSRYYFGNPKTKKCLFVAGGAALDNIRACNQTDGEICATLIEKEANFTRIDHAITIYNSEHLFTLAELQEAYAQGKIESPLTERGGKIISTMELDGKIYPETFYIGDLEKRGKKGIFRAYDKGAMLDVTREILMRIELEERCENAHNSAKRIAQGASVSAVFKSRFNIKTEKFQAIFDAESVFIQRGKQKEKEIMPSEKRWKWLIEQVAPTLRKALNEEKMSIEESENFAKFCAESGLGGKITELAMVMANRK